MADRILHKIAGDLSQRFFRCQHHERLAFNIKGQADLLDGGKLRKRLGRSASDCDRVRDATRGVMPT